MSRRYLSSFERSRWRFGAVVAFLVLGAMSSLAAVVAAAALDRAEFGGRNVPRHDLVDDAGSIIGTVYMMRAETTVNLGQLQVISGGSGRTRAPYWAILSPPPGFTAIGNEGIGWPFRCINLPYGVDHRAVPPRATRLMARVIVPGLIGNITLFACAWLGAAVLFRAARSAWRRYRCLCPACGYDLQGLGEPGCPECGWERAGIPTAGAGGTREVLS